MALHNVLPFTVPAPAVVGRRQRARPANVIPLRPRLRPRHPSRATALYAVAAILLWAGGIVLGLAAFRSLGSMSDFASPWLWWPIL